MPHFIPRNDDACLAWSANYVQRINADPLRYDISHDDAAELAVLQADFAEKLFLTQSPLTRTAVAVNAKNAARAAMEHLVRRTAGNARAMPAPRSAVRSVLKVSVGNRPNRLARGRILSHLPSTPHLAEVKSQQSRGIKESVAIPFPKKVAQANIARAA